MKPLSLHARQTNQRRMTAFYLSPQQENAANNQIEIKKFKGPEDRPRTLREMFPDADFSGDDDDL
ncbi:hypothetical protein [Eoetvoesiella caeni]|uniref:Uncharacterized protein n=1 Tax=Eoetvoesiella caeni TaxID=645616 RepID=A0A366H5V2_9BURK|nr:hypothetical protein [Eoetvoesiella caeni]MCI2810479.1 hypothetical protein [Eoetvoesiella caeni]NYT54849.1 hypothetical protein [Eoetvoesiella caeni]RBP36764.1 hypothetical protein DFR37_11172 [Eoetvoesiella caeni]